MMRLLLLLTILCFKILYAEPVVIKSVSLNAGSGEITITGDRFDTACRVYVEAGGPYVTGSVKTDDFASEVCVSGNYSGQIDVQGQVAGISVVGNYAYIAERNSGLQIVDISNPAKPKVASKLNIAGARGISVSGDCAYITDGTGLKVVDVSNRVSPNIVDVINTAGYMGKIMGENNIVDTVDVAGDYAYTADGILGMGIVYMGDRSAPRMVGHINTYGNVAAVQAIGNYACVADGNTGMKVIDIRNKAIKNRIAGSIGTPGYASGIYVLAPFAYVADQRGGLQVVDISNPDNPVIVSSVGAYYASKVFIKDKYIYFSDWNSVVVLHKSSTTDLLHQAKVVNDKTIKAVVSKELLPGKYNIKIINSLNEWAVLHNELTIN